MEISRLNASSLLPGLFVAEDGSAGAANFSDWIAAHHDRIESALAEHGALLMRGVGIRTPLEFALVCGSIYPRLRSYRGGDSPRTELVDKVFTSTDYGAEHEVLLHNELSYAGWSPQRVMFGCLVAPLTGGQTHLADGRQVYRALNGAVRDRFDRKGVAYWQHLRDQNGPPGTGLSWQQTFETSDPYEVEAYLAESAMEYSWTTLGIRTCAKHAAAVDHPVTGDRCWHNQADQWHCRMVSVKDTVGTASVDKGANGAGRDTLGNHTTFGDGSEIDVKDLEHIREVCRLNEVCFNWMNGDVLIIDNVMTMHGRKPYKGERQIVVAMA
ncbi:MAG: hypothetical protein HKN85_06555 [Gammaproteobacteria bacterium]|nr:hypothetical protein [Gammaproteobacteria bacterium]